MSRYFDANDNVLLVITPEGTRGKARVWKSGFWRIADALDVPVYMGFVDAKTKTTGFGPRARSMVIRTHGWTPHGSSTPTSRVSTVPSVAP